MAAPHEAEIVACIPSLRRYARGLAHDPARADDLVQDTLERAWGRFPSWQGRGAVRAWMFGIMHNLYVDLLRRQSGSPEDGSGDGELPDGSARTSPADGLELRDVERALQRLPAEHREVLLLVAVEELSYKEIAAAIGLPIGTVMSRLSRARERLRAELDRRDVAPLIQRVK
jgi:RNA polymerase sigma-70 factor (ECF subfamily)